MKCGKSTKQARQSKEPEGTIDRQKSKRRLQGKKVWRILQVHRSLGHHIHKAAHGFVLYHCIVDIDVLCCLLKALFAKHRGLVIKSKVANIWLAITYKAKQIAFAPDLYDLRIGHQPPDRHRRQIGKSPETLYFSVGHFTASHLV